MDSLTQVRGKVVVTYFLCYESRNSVSQGHVEVVDKLLQHGATVDLQDKVIS